MKRIIITICVLFLCAMVPLWVKRHEAHERQLAEAAVARVMKEYCEVDLRPVLSGEEVAGRAREAYDQSLAEVSALQLQLGWILPVSRQLSSEKAQDQEAVRAVLKRAEDAFGHLDRGTRCRDAGRRMRWDGDNGREVPSLLVFRDLINLTSLKMAERHRAGDEAGLIASFLDGLQISGDFMRSPLLMEEMIGASGVWILCSAFSVGDENPSEERPIVIDLMKLSRPSKAILSQALRQFLGALPHMTRAIEIEAVLFWQAFLRGESFESDASLWSRFDKRAGLLSPESLLARSVREALTLGAAYKTRVAAPEADDVLILRELQRERSPVPDRMLFAFYTDWESSGRTRQWSILRLWLLTTALEFAIETKPQTFCLAYGLSATLGKSSDDRFWMQVLKDGGPVPEHLQHALVGFVR